MRKLVVCLVVYYLFTSCSPTTLNKDYIKGRRFEGYIFSKESLITPIHFEDSKERYSPTKEDIIQAEEIIKSELKNTNDLMNQSGECPNIHTHLGKYKRQYIGYINTAGDKVIWVNFLWKKGIQRPLDKEVIIIFDGCSHYWRIKVNLTQRKLSDLQVNGSA